MRSTGMNQKRKHRRLSLLLAAVLILGTSAVQGPDRALAAVTAPGSAAFASRDELMECGLYNLTTHKVYFGLNGASPQQWYIAGKDSTAGGMVLICNGAQPMGEDQIFESTTAERPFKGSEWGTYPYSFTGSVYPNHYGASTIRRVLQSYASDLSRFSAAEQAMMKNTQISVRDAKNSVSYWVMDKLYLPSGVASSPYNRLSVGSDDNIVILTNDSDLGISARFWLRTPTGTSDGALVASFGSASIATGYTDSGWNLVPAFCLDTADVLFASTAEKGKATASFDSADTMTLRCSATSSLIGSSAEYTSGKVTVKKGSDAGKLYLYVQGCDNGTDFVYSKEITGDTQVFAADVRASVTDLSECRIWLETVSDRVAYAKMAEKSSSVGPGDPSGPGVYPGQITPDTPASADTLESTILALPSDNDPAFTTFSLLQAKGVSKSKTSVRLSWKRVSGAAEYIIYGNRCGKGIRYEKIATVSGTTFTQTNLKKGTYYKYLITAVNGNTALAVSKTIHVATKGGKVGNHTKVTLNSKKKTLKAGKSFKLKATLKKGSLKVKNHRKVAYESSDLKIAEVNGKGKIKAKAKGTCFIYAYAQNGVCAKCKVTVK